MRSEVKMGISNTETKVALERHIAEIEAQIKSLKANYVRELATLEARKSDARSRLKKLK